MQVQNDALCGLEEKLREGEKFLGQPPPPLLLAVAHLAGASPPGVLLAAFAKLLPWLLAALTSLNQGLLIDAEALAAALRAINSAGGHAAGNVL